MTVQEFQKLKDEMESLQRAEAKSQGVLSQLKRRLKELGCSTIKEAKTTIADLKEEVEADESMFETGLEQLREKYPEQLPH